MNKIHEKSPCCRGDIWRFGQRRRQCAVCQKTWSLWKKKRGRKRIRQSRKSLVNYLAPTGQSPYAPGYADGKSRITQQARTARLRASRNTFVQHTAWPELPQGDLILLCDALLQPFDGALWTMYFFFVRPVKDNRATLLPLYFKPGREASKGGWKQAFATIPESVQSRIVALISDGAPTAVYSAKVRGWILQRCQFHLLMSLANYVRPGDLSRHKTLAALLYPKVYVVLYERDAELVHAALGELEHTILPMLRNRKLISILSGFIKHYEDYRSYLTYPAYGLPATTSSVESFIGQIRRLLHRARGFKTPESFRVWIEAFCKSKKSITCNGKHQQN